MSMTTVLPMDEDQCRTPVIFGSAANLFSATALSGAASEPSFDGFIRLSEIAGTIGGERTSAGGAGGVVTDCGEVVAAIASTLVTAVFPRTCMPHQAPAENNAATATRPITTLNAGRELPGSERRCRNGKTRGDWSGAVDSSFSDRISDGISNGTAKGSSATPRSVNSINGSGNSTRAAAMTTGCSSIANSGTWSGIDGVTNGACSVAEKIAAAGNGASPVSILIIPGSISGISIAAPSATTGTSASGFACRTSP